MQLSKPKWHATTELMLQPRRSHTLVRTLSQFYHIHLIPLCHHNVGIPILVLYGHWECALFLCLSMTGSATLQIWVATSVLLSYTSKWQVLGGGGCVVLRVSMRVVMHAYCKLSLEYWISTFYFCQSLCYVTIVVTTMTVAASCIRGGVHEVVSAL